MTLGVVFFLLAVLAFAPIFLFALNTYPGNFLVRLEALVEDYDSLIISLGTLALVSALALLTTHLSSVSAERREKSSQRVQSELKIAEFRREWIESFRDDLSRFGILIFSEKKSGDRNRERLQLEMKLHMRLNHKEKLARELWEAITEARQVVGEGDIDAKNEALRNFTLAGNRFLRNEWRRLLSDVKEARVLKDTIE